MNPTSASRRPPLQPCATDAPSSRRPRRDSAAPITLRFGSAVVDLARQSTTVAAREVHLTAKEFAMLRLLADTPGAPVSRERFLDVVWGVGAFPTTRTVDTHIASLRAKLETHPEAPQFLKTVHGIGDQLELGDTHEEPI
jgi:DNA-binding response OmpR family regulator